MLPTCALALPGALLVAGTAVLLGLLPFGVDPIWYVEPLTLPEAAALRDNAEVVRLIELGEDPNAAGPVRAGFVYHNRVTLTPLEAAVGARRADMVVLLLENGASLTPETWTRLKCFAEVVDDGEVRSLLENIRPHGAADACAGVQTPWQ